MAEKESDRREPHSIEAEAAVLGAMLLDGEAVSRVVELLGEERTAFYHPSHRTIYGTMLALYERNKPVDLVTLSEELRRRKELDSIGGSPYLATLMEQVTTAANVEYYARIVLEKGLARKVIQAGTTIVQEGYNERVEADQLLDRAESLIFSIKEKRLREGFVPMKALIHGTFGEVEELYHQKNRISGVPSGFKDLDEMTSGFQPSDLVVIACKARHVGDAAASAATLLGPETTVLTIQNGLGSGEAASAVLGPDRVAIGVAGGFGAS
ncbi:hypothetical protein IIA15_10645, partial [candidate division TA06 bacterium]|nr:hypothetical protein [candidate division TA06 bacterium]